jgi:hypothetical protein
MVEVIFGNFITVFSHDQGYSVSHTQRLEASPSYRLYRLQKLSLRHLAPGLGLAADDMLCFVIVARFQYRV